MKKLLILTLLFLLCIGAFYCNLNGISIAALLTDLTGTQIERLEHINLSGITDSGSSDSSVSQPSPSADAQKTQDTQTTEVRGLWVATAYAIDYPAQASTDADTLRADCDAILEEAQADGINTIYFQVRPSCDALYASKLFPWSMYLTGTCGTAPVDGFDPLEYWVTQAHRRSMALYAWINPYRVCGGENAARNYAALPASSPAKQHADWVVSYDGGYYFDPGIPEVRQLIADGVEEIVTSYEVDGIQFDDYFYPGTDFDDADSYKKYGEDFSDLADWRRENVSQLIQLVYRTLHDHAQNKTCSFSVSPSGIWRNQSLSCPSGSKTHGYQHYSESYADSMAWIDNGIIDEICPQIYWEIGNSAADFETLAHWWADAVHGTNVRLVLGLAAYKINDASFGDVWKSDGCEEIARQIELTQGVEDISGISLFSAARLKRTDGLSQTVRAAFSSEKD